MTKKSKRKGLLEGFNIESKSGLCKLKVKDHTPEQMLEIGNELSELALYILSTLGDKFNANKNVAVVRARVNKETGEVDLDTDDLNRKLANAAREDSEEDKGCTCIKCLMRELRTVMDEAEESLSK